MEAAVPSKSTAIVLSSRSSVMREIAMSLMPIASRTDSTNLPPRVKIERAFARVVRQRKDENMPYVTLAKFLPKKDKSGKVVIETIVEIPDPDSLVGTISVPARPHLMIDGKGGTLPFVGKEKIKDGDRTFLKYVPKSHLCIVLFPLPTRKAKSVESNHAQKPEFYRVLPLALAPVDILEKWNRIAQGYRALASPENKEKVEAQWPIIAPMSHSLNKRLLTLTFVPKCYEPIKSFRKTDEESKDDDERVGWTFGDIFGQRVIDATNGEEVPPADQDADGKTKYIKEQTFKVVAVSESAIRVKWIGFADAVDIGHDVALEFEQYKLDGFAALGLDIQTADMRSVMKVALRLVGHNLDEGNPLYMYALGRGEVSIEQSTDFTRNVLRQIARAAAEHVQRELMASRTQIFDQCVTAVLPTLQDVLNGKEIASVWYQKYGDDFLATWLSEKLGSEFNWGSWLHTSVRTDVLKMISSKEGVEQPARPANRLEEPKTGEAPPVETAPEVPQEATSEEIPAPTLAVKKPSKRKK